MKDEEIEWESPGGVELPSILTPDWAVFWNRCRAVLEDDGDHIYFGRCDLKRHFDSDHILERGMEEVHFRTVRVYP